MEILSSFLCDPSTFFLKWLTEELYPVRAHINSNFKCVHCLYLYFTKWSPNWPMNIPKGSTPGDQAKVATELKYKYKQAHKHIHFKYHGLESNNSKSHMLLAYCSWHSDTLVGSAGPVANRTKTVNYISVASSVQWSTCCRSCQQEANFLPNCRHKVFPVSAIELFRLKGHQCLFFKSGLVSRCERGGRFRTGVYITSSLSSFTTKWDVSLTDGLLYGIIFFNSIYFMGLVF